MLLVKASHMAKESVNLVGSGLFSADKGKHTAKVGIYNSLTGRVEKTLQTTPALTAQVH